MKLRDEPCEKCGWRYLGFHICQDLSGPEPELPPEKKRDRKPRERDPDAAEFGSVEWRTRISEGLRIYHNGSRERNKARDDTILRLYREGLSILKIRERTGLNHQTIGGVLRREEAAGNIVIRRTVVDSERDDRIAHLYLDEYHTISEIAEIMELSSPESVRRALHRMQKAGRLQLRRKGRRAKKE